MDEMHELLHETGAMNPFDVALDHVTLAHENPEVEFIDHLVLEQFDDPELKIYIKCPADSEAVDPSNVGLLSVSIEDWANKSVSANNRDEKIMRDYDFAKDGEAFEVIRNDDNEIRYVQLRGKTALTIVDEMDKAQIPAHSREADNT